MTRAFTLVEVLIALALSLTLIAAVYLSISMYLRYSTAGRARIERDQLARALLAQMTVDIESIVFTPPENAESEGQALDGQAGAASTGGASSLGNGGGSSGAGTAGADNTSAGTAGSGGPAPASSGLVVTQPALDGTYDSLTLLINRPQRTADYISFGGGSTLKDRTSDLQSVTYLMAGSESTTLAAAVTAAQSTSRETASGLTRIIADGLPTQIGVPPAEEALAEEATILAEEVATLGFRYFNGNEWSEYWNTNTQGQVPQAIEITLEIKEEVPRGPDDRTEPQPILHSYRTVVALPIRKPYAGLTTF